MNSPLNQWAHITIEGGPQYLAFTYADGTAGPSAKGTVAKPPLAVEHAKRASQEPESTIRLLGWGDRLSVRVLSEIEVRDLGLPDEPRWLDAYKGGPNQPWRNDPLLRGKFLPDYPDDIQVLIHSGNPRFSGKRPELVWVRVTQSCGPCYVGAVLNQPEQLDNVHSGENVLFMAVQAAPHPFLVEPNYVEDRKNWNITPCNKCGFTEMFQPPTSRAEAFMRENNVSADNAPIMLSTFCPLCGGVQLLSKIGTEAEEQVKTCGRLSQKKWWQFWKKGSSEPSHSGGEEDTRAR